MIKERQIEKHYTVCLLEFTMCFRDFFSVSFCLVIKALSAKNVGKPLFSLRHSHSLNVFVKTVNVFD